MITGFFRFLIGAILAILGTALTGLIALDVFYPANPWTGGIKGQALVLVWDRQSTLTCNGYSIMTVEGSHLERKFGPLFEASGHCQLRLQGVYARAPRIVLAREDSHVVIAGGHLEATAVVIEASDRAVVQLEGAELVGPQKRDGAARIEGAAAQK